MPKLLFTLIAAWILALPAARAQQETKGEEDHAAHHAGNGQTAGHETDDPGEHLRANMKAMQDVMARVRDTTDAAEKRRLLRVHMLAMQEQIRTIRSAGSAAHDHGNQGDAKGSEGKGGDAKKDSGMMGGGMMKGGMMKMHKKVEQRLDSLEGLLEQLIEHEAAEDALGSQ